MTIYNLRLTLTCNASDHINEGNLLHTKK